MSVQASRFSSDMPVKQQLRPVVVAVILANVLVAAILLASVDLTAPVATADYVASAE